MSDMIKLINTQNHSQNPRIDRFQAQTTQIDLKFQAIRIQQEILSEVSTIRRYAVPCQHPLRGCSFQALPS